LDDRADRIHVEIWRRFIDNANAMLDFTTPDGYYDRPTPRECRECKPNALAWWTPTENGSMFNGYYLDAACSRWKLTRAPADREKAQRLALGLLFLSSVGDTSGFIARGVATDRKTTYPMGSNDQTLPWFYGLWRYLDSGAPDVSERKRIVARMTEVAGALEANGWRMPCTSGSPSRYRGSFNGFSWDSAPRLLFLLRAMEQVTGDNRWGSLYRKAIDERGGSARNSRREVCARGMVFEGRWPHSWTGAGGAISLRALWEMEP